MRKSKVKVYNIAPKPLTWGDMKREVEKQVKHLLGDGYKIDDIEIGYVDCDGGGLRVQLEQSAPITHQGCKMWLNIRHG